jgi:hypothetical protein
MQMRQERKQQRSLDHYSHSFSHDKTLARQGFNMTNFIDLTVEVIF